jgi:2-dehydro-3-deoxyphosphogluconate aldolase / (4S)-4-hydroxy-2-oxoglutarate aldolase
MSNLFDHHPIVPVLVLERLEDALPAVEALLEGGLGIVEVTLRTPSALPAIERIAKHLPMIRLGAGMVLRPADITAARNAGAQFLVSPGLTTDLAAAGIASGLPYLPGAVTPTEIMAAREFGFSFLKFFPAREFGGPAMLRHYAAAFPGIVFCPSGGVGEADSAEYLALPNVPAIGASWIASREALDAKDWRGIMDRAKRATALANR